MPDESSERDLRGFVLPELGQLLETGDRWEPFRLLDRFGKPVEPTRLYLRELAARDSSPLTPRSYGMDLLRWFRFLWALDVAWDRATRNEARDFMWWMKIADKPVRPHWRRGRDGLSDVLPVQTGRLAPGTPNPVTGKPTVGVKYASSTRAHCETVLRQFYNFHLDSSTGSLLINPFPLVRPGRLTQGRQSGRDGKHRDQRAGLYRPKVPERIPRRIPDEMYTEVFAGLRSHRDRALLAFWVATGARAEELLSATQGGAIVGQQIIGVVRKGSRDYQELPASPDAFVWLRLYQEESWKKGVPRGRSQPL
ncbi:integrase [Streptomyces sp. NPDC050147]|uniref:integrase n=1 Tax=Streptomyces sp. NPDC050147 TaxID=3155513 RepID=UPI003445782A